MSDEKSQPNSSLLCNDMINEIANHLDTLDILAYGLTNKNNFHVLRRHVKIKMRDKLIIILKTSGLSKNKTRKYYKSVILNLNIGDRVTDTINNYIVTYIEKKIAILTVVDMYGDLIVEYPGDQSITFCYLENIKLYNRKADADGNNFFWITYNYNEDGDTCLIMKLKYGII